VLVGPCGGLGDFGPIGGCRQDLCKQRIGIQRDAANEIFQDYSLDTNTNLVAGAGGRGSKEPDKKDEIIRGRRIAISGAAPVDSRQLPLRQCPPGSHRFDGTTDSSSFTPVALICNLSRQARS